jgi:peptidoglycan hydrolase-like protein with peptidoglycan-binding domain
MARLTVCAALAWSAIATGGVALADSPAASVVGLQQGARGDGVRALQQALVDQGISVAGGVDGVFGAATTDAIRRFQHAKGFPITGVVDDATASALGITVAPTSTTSTPTSISNPTSNPTSTSPAGGTNTAASIVGLSRGARGEAVRSLQRQLIAAGYAVRGGADGIFGTSTAAALQQFQTASGLTATGVVDEATAAALSAAPAPTTAPATTVPAAPPTTVPAPTTPSGTIVGLQQGARGELVRQLQQQLTAARVTGVGPADGIFGARTASALRAFQTAAGLPATGIVDDATAAALATAVATPAPPTTPTPTTPTTQPVTLPPTPPPSGGAPGATSPLLGLRLGSSGEAVKTLQRTIVQAGVQVRGGADGKFGLSTQAALKQYQQLAGLPTSGVVDDATASALASGRSVNGGTTSLSGLRAGAIGASVKALQQALIAAGVQVRGGADGVFGPATTTALQTFQTSQGLTATGVVDDVTVAALSNPEPITTPPPTGSSTTGYAVFGEKGPRVLALQTALARAGVSVRGGIDGDFGPGTSAAVMDFQRLVGLRVTGKVDDGTAGRLGLAKQDPPRPADPATVRLQVFPVQGRCYFADTWLAARSGGRTHQGVDVIAPQGKAIYAVTDGTITKVYSDYPGSLAGNGVRLGQADGTYFFYAHMLSLAPGVQVGTAVRAGQVIGYVGSTGSSATNHLHFEVHPKGGAAINPYPVIKAIDGCGVTDLRPQ